MTKNCNNCILDGTDACPYGAGRTIEDKECEEFISERSRRANHEETEAEELHRQARALYQR